MSGRLRGSLRVEGKSQEIIFDAIVCPNVNLLTVGGDFLRLGRKLDRLEGLGGRRGSAAIIQTVALYHDLPLPTDHRSGAGRFSQFLQQHPPLRGRWNQWP